MRQQLLTLPLQQRAVAALAVVAADAAGGAARLLRQRMRLVRRLQILSKQMPLRRQSIRRRLIRLLPRRGLRVRPVVAGAGRAPLAVVVDAGRALPAWLARGAAEVAAPPT